jgi:hypothetical protein
MPLTEQDRYFLEKRNGKDWEYRVPKFFKDKVDKARAKLPPVPAKDAKGYPFTIAHSVAVPPITVNFQCDRFSESPEWYVQSWYFDSNDPRHHNPYGYHRGDWVANNRAKYYYWHSWRTKWCRPLTALQEKLKRLSVYCGTPYVTEYETTSGREISPTLWVSMEEIGFTVNANELIRRGPDAIVVAMLKRRRKFRERMPQFRGISKSSHISFPYSENENFIRNFRRWKALRKMPKGPNREALTT